MVHQILRHLGTVYAVPSLNYDWLFSTYKGILRNKKNLGLNPRPNALAYHNIPIKEIDKPFNA